jgi:hypothetical protein
LSSDAKPQWQAGVGFLRLWPSPGDIVTENKRPGAMDGPWTGKDEE